MSSIRQVIVDVLEVPFREPIVTGAGRWDRRRLALVRLRGDDGAEGMGEVATGSPDGLPPGVGTALADALTEALSGMDAADDALLEASLGTIDRWPVLGRAVRSAVETAVVDLLARLAGSSVAATLAPRPRSLVRINDLVQARDARSAASAAAALAASGSPCLKVKGGGEPLDATVARLAAVREAVGPRVELRLDVNGSWDMATATEAMRVMASLDLEYVEQPVPADTDPDALAGLRWKSDVPIAADESVRDFDTARRLLAAGAVDVLVVKPARVGGLRQAWRIAEAAGAAGVPVVVSTLFETGIGLAAALHLAAAQPDDDRAHGLATGVLLASDLLAQPLTVDRGWMTVPDGPGLGIRLDEAAVDMFRAA